MTFPAVWRSLPAVFVLAAGAAFVQGGQPPNWQKTAEEDLRLINPPCPAGSKMISMPDFGLYEKALQSCVSKSGMVNYKKLREDENFKKFLAQWGCLDVRATITMSQAAQTAFWINMQNAHLMAHVASLYPISSTDDVPNFYRRRVAKFGPFYASHQNLYDEAKRASKGDPRVVFALSDGTIAGPPIRRELYTAEQLESQMEDQVRAFLARPSNFRISVNEKRLYVSKLFQREGSTILAKHGSLPAFLVRYARNEMEADILRNATFDVHFVRYDRGLNGEGAY